MKNIGILLFPGVEELDFAGPFEVLSYINKVRPDSVNVRIVAHGPEPVQCFNGLKVVPDWTIDACPPLDIVVVPGGQGRRTAAKDERLLSYLRQQHAVTQYTCSVCTGAFLLAEAGLLRGKQATTYHTAVEELAQFPDVTVRKDKVVQDGKIITAAGVSSGLELGFHVAELLYGRELALEVARRIEYHWQPNEPTRN